jgi:hypothetical protein
MTPFNGPACHSFPECALASLHVIYFALWFSSAGRQLALADRYVSFKFFVAGAYVLFKFFFAGR